MIYTLNYQKKDLVDESIVLLRQLHPRWKVKEIKRHVCRMSEKRLYNIVAGAIALQMVRSSGR